MGKNKMKRKTFIDWLFHRAENLHKTGGYLMMTNEKEEKLIDEMAEELQRPNKLIEAKIDEYD